MGNFAKELTQVQQVALILIHDLGEPNLVIKVLKWLCKLDLDARRDFHISLRTKKEIYSHVPINFQLPFDGCKWRGWVNLNRDIQYIHPGFLQLSVGIPGLEEVKSVKEKVRIINKMFHERHNDPIFGQAIGHNIWECYTLFREKVDPLPADISEGGNELADLDNYEEIPFLYENDNGTITISLEE